MTTATDRQIEEQLDAIIAQAKALREGKVTNRLGAVSLLANNVDTLRHWELRREVEETTP